MNMSDSNQELIYNNLMQELQKLHEKIDNLIKLDVKPDEQASRIFNEVEISSYRTAELQAALAKAQAEIKPAGLTSENPYFKSRYADLTEMVRVSRPALTKNQLSVAQNIVINEAGQKFLHTHLGHASGQWTASNMPITPAKNDIQAQGSYISYLKRYAYGALIGVVTTDEDDDGEQAVYDQRATYAKGVALNTSYKPKHESADTVTKEQLEELEYELKNEPDITEMVLEGYRIQSLADMPKSKFMTSIQRIREIKADKNGK